MDRSIFYLFSLDNFLFAESHLIVRTARILAHFNIWSETTEIGETKLDNFRVVSQANRQ